MKQQSLETLLHQLHLLPYTNSLWKKMSITLYTKFTREQYTEVKKKIRQSIPKGTGGIYIIAKEDKVLYIGESRSRIVNRLLRHMDKIHWRKDSRADFFKLQEHQGELTLYYRPLEGEWLLKRKIIEELLTIVLKPAYIEYLCEKRISDIRLLLPDR